MKNKDSHIDILELIGKYLSREASREEISYIEGWVKESDANEKLFKETRQLWAVSSISSKNPQINMDEEWTMIRSKISIKKEIKPVKERLFRQIYLVPAFRVAAAVVLLLTISYFIYQAVGKSKTSNLVAINSTLAGVLPDGSEITLNHNSSLIFPKTFDDNIRKVKLSGDAFFKVEHSDTQPFVIETQNSIVKVLGTEFYVNSHKEDEKIEVVVTSGKVSFTVEGMQTLILTAGEKGVFNKKDKVFIEEENKDENFISWKTKKMIFDNQSLSYVMKVLENTYHKNIDISSQQIKDCRLTATFNNQSLEAIFTILRETFNINITKEGDNILIEGESCD